jgi:hypothetical protein
MMVVNQPSPGDLKKMEQFEFDSRNSLLKGRKR